MQAEADYKRIECAIQYIREHHTAQPSLEDIAGHVHMSPYHFQRLFSRWAGISPKKFLQYLTLQYAKEQIREDLSLSEIAFEAGLSGTSRLHDLFISMEGMTPGQYKKPGKGITIHYGFHQSPFANKLFSHESSSTLKLLVKGTPFQLKVWEALLKIPFGELVSYQSISEYVDNPRGLQATGSAIGKNPVAFLIPCHRVVRKTGEINGYRWGLNRKSALIGWEAAHQ